jgi:DNA repair exonuclease SbcCD ATPase subunit
VPDWVADLFRITKVEDLDVHIAHQKFPVFLLGETASRRSAVLSIGQEASYIRDMLVIHRERCARDNALVRNGEKELIALNDTLAGFEELDALKRTLAALREQAGRIEASAAHLRNLQSHAAQLADLKRRLGRIQARADATAGLPSVEQIAHLTRAVERARERERIGRQVVQRRDALSRSQARLAALHRLPEAAPVLENMSPAQHILKRLGDLRSAARIVQGRMAQIDAGMRSVQADMARLVEETGGLCPTCGSPVKPETLLNHSHSHEPSERLTA